MTLTAKKPIVYTGDGSAIDNYLRPEKIDIKNGQYTDNSNWGFFDLNHKYAKVHKLIRSICITKEWSIPNERYGVVADTQKLSDFLKSNKSPVNKPLMKMNKPELEKIIVALKGVVVHHWDKKAKIRQNGKQK